MPIEALTTAGCVLTAMICYTCGSVVRVFHAQPRMAVNSRLHPCWCHRVLVCRAWLVPGTHCTSGVTSEDSHASAVIVGLHQPHASVNWRSALASAVQGLSHPSRTQCVRLAETRLSGPRLLQLILSLQGHRLIRCHCCDAFSIGWDRWLAINQHLTLFSCS